MRSMQKVLWMLAAVMMVFSFVTGSNSYAAGSKSYTVTANLFVPGNLNKQLPGVTAYLTNGNNPLGIGGYPAVAPTEPVHNNATLTIDEQGRKIVVVDILNPVFTLQQIESGKNVKILDYVKDEEIYTANKNSIKGRITQITVELLDDSGTYTFTNCREYPTLLGTYWEVPLTLSVDLTDAPSYVEQPTEVKNEEKTLENGTVVNTITQLDGSAVVTMTTVKGSSSITSVTAKGVEHSIITLSKDEAIFGVELPIQPVVAKDEANARTLQFIELGDETTLQVAVPVQQLTNTVVVLAEQAGGQSKLIVPSYKNGHALFTAEKNVTYKLINNNVAFQDVKDNAWYKEAVQFMAAREWITGANNQFMPNEQVTRGMVVTILHRIAGQPEASVNHSFKDVLPNYYYTKAVAWANAQGYVKGYDAATFGVDNPMTREHFAIVLWRYAGSPVVAGSLSKFSDAHEISASSKDALIWAVENGILSGNADGTLDPKGNTTRAHTAQMLMKFMQKVQTN